MTSLSVNQDAEFVEPNPLYYRAGVKVQKFGVNVWFNLGGLGDFIARLPALKYYLDVNRNMNVTLWVPAYFYHLAKYFLRDEPRIEIKDSVNIATANRNYPLIQFNGAIQPLGVHLVDYGFLQLCNEMPLNQALKVYPEYKPQCDLSRFALPDRYIVLTVGATSMTRIMVPKTVNEILDWCERHKLSVVFLGKSELERSYRALFPDDVDFERGTNLINKTSILECADVLYGAQCVVGVDNGLLHLSACTPSATVWGFTTVRPEHRRPLRAKGRNYEVVPTAKLACRFCQSHMRNDPMRDFRKCPYEDHACCDALSAEMFIDKIKEALNVVV